MEFPQTGQTASHSYRSCLFSALWVREVVGREVFQEQNPETVSGKHLCFWVGSDSPSPCLSCAQTPTKSWTPLHQAFGSTHEFAQCASIKRDHMSVEQRAFSTQKYLLDLVYSHSIEEDQSADQRLWYMKSKQFEVALNPGWPPFSSAHSPLPVNLQLTHTPRFRNTDLIHSQRCSLLFSPRISGSFLNRQIQLSAL